MSTLKVNVKTRVYGDGKLDVIEIRKPGQQKPLTLDFEYNSEGYIRSIDFEGSRRDLPSTSEILQIVNAKFIDHIRRVQKLVELEDNILQARIISTRVHELLFDGFENYTATPTEKWRQTTGTLALATDYPSEGKTCMSMTTAAVILVCTGHRIINPPTLKKLGLQVDFQSNEGIANITFFTFQMVLYNGVDWRNATVKYLGGANKKWQYRNTVGSFVDIPGAAQTVQMESAQNPMYTTFKLIADFENSKYVELISGCESWDLSDLPIDVGADTSGSRLDLGFELGAAAGKVCRIDNVIVTDES